MLLFAQVQPEEDSADDAAVNILEGLAQTEDVQINNDVNILEELGLFRTYMYFILVWLSSYEPCNLGEPWVGNCKVAIYYIVVVTDN